MFRSGERDQPTEKNNPTHLVCVLCGQCSTALNKYRECWRHPNWGDSTSGDNVYYFGRVETKAIKHLPLPVGE
jgi:hypothetical protein